MQLGDLSILMSKSLPSIPKNIYWIVWCGNVPDSGEEDKAPWAAEETSIDWSPWGTIKLEVQVFKSEVRRSRLETEASMQFSGIYDSRCTIDWNSYHNDVINSLVSVWVWIHIIILIHIILYDYVKIKRETYLWHSGRHRCISSIRGDGQFHISNSGGGYQWGGVQTDGAISYSRERRLWGGGIFRHVS